MNSIGECLACYKLSLCNETSLERVMTGYTCPLFAPVPEGIFMARVDMILKYGDVQAIETMLYSSLNKGDTEE